MRTREGALAMRESRVAQDPGGLATRRSVRLGALAALLVTLPATPFARAELTLPPGFTAEVYVTGQGFEAGGERGARGIPATSTVAVDLTGALHLARTGARFRSGDVEDLTTLYRIPPGGGRLTPETESRYLYGPPLKNPQVGGVGPGGELYVTTYDGDRKLGALYRVRDGRAQLFAGGTPPPGAPPLLRHPEGVAVDMAGRVYVADREQGAVLRFEPDGRLLDPRFATVTRARMLAFDETGRLWIAGDGTAETPFQTGAGQIWRVAPDGTATLVVEGPLAAGMGLSPAGTMFVAQRRTGQVFALTAEGRRIDFAKTAEGTFLRSLVFAPVSQGTRRAGIAGDLLVIAIPRQIWAINEVIRISGPFDEWMRREVEKPGP